MSSESRSNSAVRNLRNIFENKASDSSPIRGRSPAGGLSPDLIDTRPPSKIRASFFAVEPAMDVLAREQQNNTDQIPATDAERTKRESSAGLRRGSMSEGHSGDALNSVQDTVAGEADRRDKESSVADTIPETAIESAAPTPLVEVNKQLQSSTALPPKILTQEADKEAENPDKPVTGAEEEPGAMKPADPASEKAVSGGKALPPVAADLRKTSSNEKKGTAAKSNGSRTSNVKPAAISTKSTAKTASAVKSPGSNTAKTPLFPPAHHGLTKKASRTSLTAPTAASVARAAAADKTTSSNGAPSKPKPKPREVTKPLEVPSRLTAPTAASRARLESATATESKPKPVAASRPKPSTTSARPTPRTSLARPESRSSQNNTRKNSAPVDGSFLERMTRPTAASSNKAHGKAEKTELKSPPRSKQLPVPRTVNGYPRGPKTTEFAASTTTDRTTGAGAAEESSFVEDESILPENDPPSSEPKTSVQPVTDGAENPDASIGAAEATGDGEKPLHQDTATKGNETSDAQTNGHQEDAATLEATPAAQGNAESIR